MPHIWIVPFVLADAQYSNPAHWSATTAIAQISDWRLAQGKLIQGKLIQGKLIQGKLIQGKLIQGKLIQGKLIQRRPGCKGPCEPFAKLPV
jgi:hypothetical protein